MTISCLQDNVRVLFWSLNCKNKRGDLGYVMNNCWAAAPEPPHNDAPPAANNMPFVFIDIT